MPPSAQAHSRSHSLLLLQKLLNLRDSAASPLTLVLDSLEQPASPLLREFVLRAKVSRTNIILVSFGTVRKPRHVDLLVSGRGKDLPSLREELLRHYPSATGKDGQRHLVLFDTLNPLASSHPSLLPAFLSSILSPATCVVAVYHDDVPLVLPASFGEHEPHPLSVLSHIATAVFRLSNLHHEVERQRARDRSVQEPEFGLREGREGAVIGLCRGRETAARVGSGGNGNGKDKGVVLQMEMRRRSGRAVVEKFVLVPRLGNGGLAGLELLRDHEEFRSLDVGGEGWEGKEEEEMPESTFNLGLTEKQRRDREGVVLPYFDAQIEVGGGEGGRILYEMGREDDFDEEEDEI